MSCISNVEKQFNEYLAKNDILKIMNKASKSFIRQLDKDEIYTCQINALWKCVKNFKPEKNVKFTTYLYTGVVIECIKNVKFNTKHKSKNSQLHANISVLDYSQIYTDIMDEAQNEEEKQILMNRAAKKTIEEIGKIMGYSRETVRKKIKKMESRIRCKFIK